MESYFSTYCFSVLCIGHSLRQGGPHNLQLERFEEAVHDPAARLTFCALSGVRKQSVEDVERLFDNL